MCIRKAVLRLALFFAASIPTVSLAASEVNKNSSVRGNEPCSPCVLILFSFDPNKNWHVTRAAAYKELKGCTDMGDRFNEDMKRKLDNKMQVTTSYYCLQADLP
jgi:hypothetical protein